MRLGRPGSFDLVYHTVKHFLDEGEAQEWDRVPAGKTTAGELVSRIPRVPGRPLPTGDPVDTRWWSPPGVYHVRRSHDKGYEPRYRLLIEKLGKPGGSRWERQGRRRWVGDIHGFRVVVDVHDEDVDVASAFFSSVFRHGDIPDESLSVFRDPTHCPDGNRPGVLGPERVR
jgi:hypothetical protein